MSILNRSVDKKHLHDARKDPTGSKKKLVDAKKKRIDFRSHLFDARRKRSDARNDLLDERWNRAGTSLKRATTRRKLFDDKNDLLVTNSTLSIARSNRSDPRKILEGRHHFRDEHSNAPSGDPRKQQATSQQRWLANKNLTTTT